MFLVTTVKPLVSAMAATCLRPLGFDVHKLYQGFRSQGQALSKDTLYNYLGYLEQSFIVFPLPVAERSLRKQAVNPKKMHTIDWALALPFVAEPTVDVGKKLETAIFLHWRQIASGGR